MTDTVTRQQKFVVFEEASTADERVGAVLVAKDTETGRLKAIVKDVPGKEGPDPEVVAALVQSYEIRNL